MPGLPTPSGSEPRRLLIRAVNWLGDAVMTTPALQRLRERFPRSHFTLLTDQKLASLWLHHPALDRVLTFSREEGVFSLASRLRAETFDGALILPNSPRSAIETWLARIPRRTGYARPWRNAFLTQAIPARPDNSPMRKRPVREIRRLAGHGRRPAMEGDSPVRTAPLLGHQIHEYLHLASALGADSSPLPPFLTVTPEEVEGAGKTWLPRCMQLCGPLASTCPPLVLGLNPSAAYGPAKRWPVENFAAVARELRRWKENCVCVVFGAANDREIGETIARQSGGCALNLAGQTSLRELMILLKLCRVVLTNDSGPMHVAAALGTPVVALFGSTSPELTGPGLPGDPRHQVLRAAAPCSPCFRRSCPIDLRCLTAISVSQAVSALRQVLKLG